MLWYVLLEGLSIIKTGNWTGGENMELFRDNKALVDAINRHQKHTLTIKEYNSPNSDVELQILHQAMFLQSQKINVKFTHIRGHQDENTPRGRLLLPAQLNIR